MQKPIPGTGNPFETFVPSRSLDGSKATSNPSQFRSHHNIYDGTSHCGESEGRSESQSLNMELGRSAALSESGKLISAKNLQDQRTGSLKLCPGETMTWQHQRRSHGMRLETSRHWIRRWPPFLSKSCMVTFGNDSSTMKSTKNSKGY